MSGVIGALRGVLSLDSAAFDSGAKRSRATMTGLQRHMVKMADTFERHGRRMALGFSLPLAGAAAIAVKSSLSVVDAQAKMAQSLDTTVKSVQVLDRAAELAGVSMGEVQQASIQLTKRLSQAAGGTGAAADALERLRLRAADLQQLPLDERIAAIQNAIERYVPAAERAAIASDLFGSRAGVIFSRIDTATLRIAADDINRFGVAVSEVDADQIELANDAISRLGAVGRGAGNQLTVGLAPSLEYIADKAADAAEWFNGLSDRTKQLAAGGIALTATLGPVALGLGLVLRATVPLAGAIGAIVSPIGLVVAGVSALAIAAAALDTRASDAVVFAEAHEIAMDNVTIAMGDQINAAARLADAMRDGGPVTLAAIEAKMAEAEASRAVTAELVRQRQEKELEVLGYYDLLEAIGRYRDTLNGMRAPGDDIEQMPLKMRAAYEEAEAGLVALLQEQKRLLEGVRAQTHLTEEEAAHVKQIEANLAELQRRWNDLNGIVTDNVELTDRSAVASGNLADGLGAAAGQAAALRGFLSGLPGALSSAQASIAGLEAGIAVLEGGGSKLAADVAKYRAELVATLPPLNEMHDGQRRNVEEGIEARVQQYQQLQSLRSAYQEQIAALGKVKGASGSASKSALAGILKEIAHRRNLIALTGEERRRYEAARAIQSRLGKETASISKAQIDALTDNLIAIEDQEAALGRVAQMQERWADQITRTAFEGGSLKDTIKGALRDIAYQFANTKIVLPVVASITDVLGLGGGAARGVGQAAGQVAGAAAGGGGAAGTLLQGVGLATGAFGSGVGLGVSSILGGTYGATLAGQLSVAATGSLTGIAGAAGMAVPVLGAVAAAISFFRSKTKRLDSGLRVTADNVGTLVESFDKMQKSRFWGLSKKVSLTFRDADEATAAPIRKSIADITGAIGMAGAQLGLTADNFSSWSTQIQVSLKGLDETAKNAEIQRIFDTVAEQFTYAALGSFNEALGGTLIREGETASDTLDALVVSLGSANSAIGLLNGTLFDTSVIGANMARHLVDQFGGLDRLNTSVNSYFTNFYSQEEQLASRMGVLAGQFEALNVTVPKTREEFRALVEAQDLSTDGGRKLYAGLLNVSGEFANLTQLSEELYGSATLAANGVSALVRSFSNSVVGVEEELAKAQAAAMVEYRNVMRIMDLQIRSAKSARDSIKGIFDILADGLSARGPLEEAAQKAHRDQLQAELAAGISDPQRLRKVIQGLNEPAEQFFSTYADFAYDYYRTSALLGQQKDVAEDQLTEAGKQLRALEDQKKSIEELYGPLLGIDQNTDNLEEAMERLETAMLGVEAAMLRVEDSMYALAQALLSAVSGIGGTGGLMGMGKDAFDQFSFDRTNGILSDKGAGVLDGIAGQINNLYQDVFGRNVDVAGLDFYGNLLQSGQVKAGRIQYDLMTSGEAQTGVTPGFGKIGSAAQPVDPVEALYGSMLARAADPAGVEFWKSTGLQGEALVSAFRDAAQAAGEAPSFDGGGYTGRGPRTGGEDGRGGFWALMHPDETVIDHTLQFASGAFRPRSGGLGGAGDLLAEMRRATDLLADLGVLHRENNLNSKRTSDAVEEMNIAGVVMRDGDAV